MDSECDVGYDFSFAFNDSHFSDRLLHIHMSEPIDSPSVEKVKTLHISSPILAARSPFFYKLFSNGMKESEQRDVTLRINASEEVAFMELLHFMYNNNMTVITASTVVDVLMVANKFDVASCMRHCSRVLRNLPMTPESMLVYLDLPSTVLMSEAFQSLTVAAKQFLFDHFYQKIKFKDEMLRLPIAAMEAIIASDDLRVIKEDAVYSFVLHWARAHYRKLRDRREVISTRLAKFIRYPYMSHFTLASLLINKNFDRGFAKKVVTEAIAFKAEVPHNQHTYIIDKKSSRSILNRWLVERVYKLRPIKMVKFEQPRPHCVVYLDLRREVCAALFPSKLITTSEYFSFFSGQVFYLCAYCNKNRFKLCLGTWPSKSCVFVLKFMAAVKSKASGEFVSIHETTTHTCEGEAEGESGMFLLASHNFQTPWSKFIGEDSDYFIDDVLHLKAELTKVSA